MRKKYIFGKKLYISVLTSILVLLTTVATTFAWVGVFANSTFESFNIGIKASSLEEYNVEISVDGIHFSNELSFTSVQRQILTNFGYENVETMTDEKVNNLYLRLNLDQCTTVPNLIGDKITSLGDFKDMFDVPTKKYIKFDMYISATKNYDAGSSSDFSMDVYLGQGMLKGRKKSYTLFNYFTYRDEFVNPYIDLINNGLLVLPDGIHPIVAGTTISTARVDSSSAARVAFEKYPVVAKGHPELYTDSVQPKSALVYQDTYEYPIYSDEGYQSFGAILPDEDNLATTYYNSTEYIYYTAEEKKISLPNDLKTTRSVIGTVPDLVLSSKTNQLIDSSNPDEQVGINTMMKMSVYFWFEGWDADCFPVINHSPVDININFMMRNEEEF